MHLPVNAQLKSSITHYSTKDGLSHDGVLCITRDRDGFMWFGTFDGLNRFDGHDFVVYKSRPGDSSSLRSNKIRNIVEDKAGYLWIQSFDYKVYRFDKRTEQFLAVSDGPYKTLFKDHVIIDRLIPDQDNGAWLLTKNQGMYYVYTTLSGTLKVTQYYKGHGISGNLVRFRLADQRGRVWIGTEGGLNCLQRGTDGNYSLARFSPDVHKLLSAHSFTAVAQTRQALYFGTEKGKLLILDKLSGRFTVKKVSDGTRSNDICISRAGVMYISTTGKGLLKYDPVNSVITQAGSSNNGNYLSLYEDRSGRIWIEPKDHGIVKYDPGTNLIKHYFQQKDVSSFGRAYNVLTDANGTIWVSMKSGGFGYYDQTTDNINYFFDEPGSQDQKFSNVLTSLFIDATGVLWMSAKDGGINKVVSSIDNFNFKRPVPHARNRSANDVRAMLKDANGRLWVCTKDGSVHVYDHQKEVSVFAGHNNQIGAVYSITEDSKGDIWLGTKGNGLFRASPVSPDRKNYGLKNYLHYDSDVNSLSNNMVYDVIEDRKGRIWVGTFGGGLNLLTSLNGKEGFRNFKNTFHTYPYSWAKAIRHLCEDNTGKIWIATSYGLLVFDPDRTTNGQYKFVAYQKVPGDRHSLGNNGVQYICKDNGGQLWVGTFGGGLNKVIVHGGDINKVSFKAFTTDNGLPNDVVLSVVVDRQNELWVATAGGLSKFNTGQQVFKNYDSFDGLPMAEFSEAACFTAPDGHLYFGCTNGYMSFDPKAITHQRVQAKMALTNMQLYYKNIVPGTASSPLRYAIDQTNSVTLNSDQNVISIDYAVLDHRAAAKVSYAYILEGFDKNWHRVNDLRKATYTNIPPGRYTFKVQGYSDELFSNVPHKKLSIMIKPPFYLTTWAYITYFILAVIAFLLTRKVVITMIRLRNKVLVEQQLTEMKLSFFTNISHELRTPLTLIASPLKELSVTEQLSARGKTYFDIVNRNVNRMIRFTDQLLDLRKIQSGKMQISVAETDLLVLARDVAYSFTAIAAEKDITLNISSGVENLYAWVDQEKIEIILYNLLSNAFKFSPPGKQITVSLEDLSPSNMIEVKVIDEGGGVPAEKLEEIFEIYHEENHSTEVNLKGTGIGLALARGLAVSHHGKLWAQLNNPGGMCFILQLKAGHDHFTKAELNVAQQPHNAGHLHATATPEPVGAEIPDTILNEDAPLILIVEDNPDLRKFLEIRLSALYRITSAGDGLEGLRIANETSPDLILSDVLMPKMDGIEMLEALRREQATSHIPVILLTARSSVESRIKGLQYGADVYLTKPFHNEVLLASIENLLTSRKRIFERYANVTGTVVAPQEETDAPVTTTKDELFLKEVIRIVEEKMKDPAFNIEDVAAGMSMGRTTFYKKLKALSSLSPVEFVRELRLKHSKVLLDSGSYTVSEAGYMVGFNSLPYFSTCFKDKYDLSPSAYLKKRRADTNDAIR